MLSKKVSDNLDAGLYYEDSHLHLYIADEIEADEDTDHGYAIRWHESDGMPARDNDFYATQEELETAMRKIAPLSKWHRIKP